MSEQNNIVNNPEERNIQKPDNIKQKKNAKYTSSKNVIFR